MLQVQEVTMKTSKTLIALVLTLAGLMAAGSASAWHREPRVSIGFGFGYPGPYYYPPYGPYGYYPHYYPAPVVIQRQPTVYIEQNPPATAAPAAPASAYWYYCADSRAYYPYVKECEAGWQRVAPQPG